MPESVEDVFSLFSPADIRRTRDNSLENLETLVLAVSSRLNVLKNHPSFPDPELAPERDALNCIRVLTRILPFLYEAENLSEWEEKFFWGTRRRKTRRAQLSGEILFDEAHNKDGDEVEETQDYEETKPLAEELIDTLIDLLFYSGFTIPSLPNARSKVTYAIWQSGVGCKASIGTSRDLESNRCEVLRLLLTITSKSMYTSSNVLPVLGVKAITYIATCPEKQTVLSVLCSLLNTTIKYNVATWRLPYDHVVWKDPKQSLVVYSLQFLLVLLLYPIPEESNGSTPKNFYRHFMGRLHRPEDFQFLADGMTRVLSQPMQATTSYLPGSQKSVRWAPEMIMLFWEVLQCNKRFRSFILESNRAHDFIILMLFYAIEYKADPTRQGIVRMCIFVLQTMSVEPTFGKNLNKKFEAQDTLPPSIRLPNFRGSYVDFLIMSIHTLITGSKGKLEVVYPALMAIISNLAPHAQNLSMTTSSKLLQLFNSTSAPSFLLANETNHALLQSLLESLNSIIEHQYTTNANLIYTVLKSRKRIEALRAFTLESGQQELERLNRRRKEGLDTDFVTSPSPAENGAPGRSNSTSESNNATEEETTFAIGDSEDSDDEINQPTPSQSSPSLRNSRTPSISSTDESLPVQLRGMSEKARGKMPAGAQSFSRQSSTASLPINRSPTLNQSSGGTFAPSPDWLESWLPELPLHTMLSLIKALSPHMPTSSSNATATSSTAPSSDSRRLSTSSAVASFLSDLPHTTSHPLISPILASPSPIKIHLFEWSPLSLGWYEGLLWSFIFVSESQIGSQTSTLATNVVGGHSTNSNAVGVWNGTSIRLFQVKTDGDRGKGPGPSLREPRGAVDAVGRRLVDGVSGLTLGSVRTVMGRTFSGENNNSSNDRRGSGRGLTGRERTVREV